MAESSTATGRPRLRGVLHQYACLVFTGLGVALIATSSGRLERISAAVFAASVALSFGVSALYHRITWQPGPRRLIRRLDHASIFLLIAGTYTPFGLLVLSGAWRSSVLAIVWTGAALAIVQQVFWPDAPKWLAAALALALGWVGVAAFPTIVDRMGVLGTALIVLGGLLYTFGAVVYVRGRPDPVPHVFGYHEVFHALTILAVASHYGAIAFYVL
ncbi:MAG: hemolysin III family protein [Gaiellaceae bacterium]